jgi:hypothetical protein
MMCLKPPWCPLGRGWLRSWRECNGTIQHLKSVLAFGWQMEWNEMVTQKRIFPINSKFIHSNKLVVYAFLCAKITPYSHTSLILLWLFVLNSFHACSHLLFLESSTFYSPMKHMNKTNSFYCSSQTKYKDGINLPDSTFYLVPKPSTPYREATHI